MIQHFDQVTSDWLTEVTGDRVVAFSMQFDESNWARHARISVTFQDDSSRKLWLKICLHPQSGRSEVDYYLRDYVNLPGAPLVKCHDAGYEPSVGYHILLDDLSEHFHDHKEVPPTLEHGLAIANGLAQLHAHHWETRSAKEPESWELEFANLRPGITNLERATGKGFANRFTLLQKELAVRWSDPRGMTLLHGDANPTNVLTPKFADTPVYFLDRQPLDGITPYGLAVYDLAYAIAPWWNRELRLEHEQAILRRWFEALSRPGYSWERAQADWTLSVEHCLFVPANWCIDPTECDSMRWLWGWQLENLDG